MWLLFMGCWFGKAFFSFLIFFVFLSISMLFVLGFGGLFMQVFWCYMSVVLIPVSYMNVLFFLNMF